MTGSLIAYALVNGLKVYEAGAVMDLVTYHKPKWASWLCCGFALIGGLKEVGSSSRSPLTRAHAHREIPSKAPFLSYNFQFDAPSALFNLDPASLVTVLRVILSAILRLFRSE